jgi:hypothetical protein
MSAPHLSCHGKNLNKLMVKNETRESRLFPPLKLYKIPVNIVNTLLSVPCMHL